MGESPALRSFVSKLQRSAIVPLALSDASRVRLSGWGSGGRPETIQRLVLVSERDKRPAAALHIDAAPEDLPSGLLTAQLLDTALSLNASGSILRQRAPDSRPGASMISVAMPGNPSSASSRLADTPPQSCAVPEDEVVPARRSVRVSIDGVACEADVTIQGRFAAVIVWRTPSGGRVLIAADGVDLDSLSLTSSHDWSAVWRAAFGAGPG